MFHYVYIIESKSKKNKFYIGQTTNLRRRLKEYNTGTNFSTKFGIPWHIVYVEACLNQKDAQRRESYLKTNQGARLIKRRIKEYLYSQRDKK